MKRILALMLALLLLCTLVACKDEQTEDDESGVDMTAWDQTGSTLTLTFNAYSSDVVVTVEVFNG